MLLQSMIQCVAVVAVRGKDCRSHASLLWLGSLRGLVNAGTRSPQPALATSRPCTFANYATIAPAVV
jgi:hypothetical protein